MVKRKIKRRISYHRRKLHEIQGSVSINKIVLQHSPARLFSYYLKMFLHYSEKVESLQQIVCGPQSLEYLLSGSFPKEFTGLWCKGSFLCSFEVLLDDVPDEIPIVKIACGELVNPGEFANMPAQHKGCMKA